MSFPDTFPIMHDDYHADRIGILPDGAQFFVTTPFRPATDDDPGEEYLAVFIFEADGAFREARIDSFGPREGMDEEAAKQRAEERMKELGSVIFTDIIVSPFSIEHQGTKFGFIPEEETGGIELQPGNYMAFFDPWDGDYDT